MVRHWCWCGTDYNLRRGSSIRYNSQQSAFGTGHDCVVRVGVLVYIVRLSLEKLDGRILLLLLYRVVRVAIPLVQGHGSSAKYASADVAFCTARRDT